MVIVDRGWRRIKTNLYWLNNRRVEVGVFASVVGAHLTLIAVANHEGARKGGKQVIPPRRFLTSAYRKNRRKLKGKRGTIARSLDGIYRKRTDGKGLLHELGLFMTTESMEAIQNFTTPANKAGTIAKKGFNDPLVHTGKLATEGITYLLGYGK